MRRWALVMAGMALLFMPGTTAEPASGSLCPNYDWDYSPYWHGVCDGISCHCWYQDGHYIWVKPK